MTSSTRGLPPRPSYGGQALIEGVLMRGPQGAAVAVRQPDGSIGLRYQAVQPWSSRRPWLRWPFVRGLAVLGQSLAIGLEALMYSLNQAIEEEEERLTPRQMVGTVALSLVLGVAFFVVLPTWALDGLRRWVPSPVHLNLIEGAWRIALLLVYTLAIARAREIHRTLQYHGAEHKAIYTWESGEELTVENARRHSRLHPRCGTSFLFFLTAASILLFTLMGWPELWQRVLTRLLLLPVLGAIAYEAIRLSGRVQGGRLGGLLLWPGLQLQRLTTREPDDEHLEVAIAALKAVVEEEERLAKVVPIASAQAQRALA